MEIIVNNKINIVTASTSSLVDMIRSYAAGFIFTTSLPPTVLAGASKAIEILASDEGRELRSRHQDNVKYLRNTLLQNGFPVEHTPSHIIPIKIGNPLQCGAVSDTLLKEKGHYIQAINYPTVAKGQEKLRLAPTPHHTKELMNLLVRDLNDVWKQLNLPLVGLQCEKVCAIISILLYILFYYYFCRNADTARNRCCSIITSQELVVVLVLRKLFVIFQIVHNSLQQLNDNALNKIIYYKNIHICI